MYFEIFDHRSAVLRIAVTHPTLTLSAATSTSVTSTVFTDVATTYSAAATKTTITTTTTTTSKRTKTTTPSCPNHGTSRPVPSSRRKLWSTSRRYSCAPGSTSRARRWRETTGRRTITDIAISSTIPSCISRQKSARTLARQLSIYWRKNSVCCCDRFVFCYGNCAVRTIV